MKHNLSLYAAVHACEECPLSRVRNHAVPAQVGAGYERGGIALLGEAPGAAEDESGKPFQPWGPGRRENAGAMVNKLLRAAGIARRDLLISNLVRCRPPNNRLQDAPGALANCEQWNIAELEEYDPALVILMGNTAMRAVYKKEDMISRMRGVSRATGTKHVWGQRVYFPTYHPAAVLRNDDLFVGVVNDLRRAKKLWEELIVPF